MKSILQQLCIFIAFGCLLPAFTGLFGFGLDLWNHFHIPAEAGIPLEYRGLWMALPSVILGGLCFGLAFLMAVLERSDFKETLIGMATGVIQVCILIMLFCLLGALIGVARFGYDLWNHFHIPVTSIPLEYGGLWIALFSVILGGLYFGLAYLMAVLEGRHR